MGFLGGSDAKESACNTGNPGSIPESGRSPGEGNSTPLQYPCLENSMDRGVWQSIRSQRVGHNWATNTFTFTWLNNMLVLQNSCNAICSHHGTQGMRIHILPYHRKWYH